MWQAEAVKELTLSASPATAVGEQTLTLANRRYSTVCIVSTKKLIFKVTLILRLFKVEMANFRALVAW